MSTNAVNPECFGHIRMSHYARCALGTYGCMRKHAATDSVGPTEGVVKRCQHGYPEPTCRQCSSEARPGGGSRACIPGERPNEACVTCGGALLGPTMPLRWNGGIYCTEPCRKAAADARRSRVQVAASRIAAEQRPPEALVGAWEGNEWRCGCTRDPAYDTSINLASFAACAKCGYIRPPEASPEENIVSALAKIVRADEASWRSRTRCGAPGPLNGPACQLGAGHVGDHQGVDGDVRSTWPQASPDRWRTGRSLGRTLYFDGVCVGMVDRPEMAEAIVAAMNARRTDNAPEASPDEMRGAAEERQRIATWLRTSPVAADSVIGDIADDIERGAHLATPSGESPPRPDKASSADEMLVRAYNGLQRALEEANEMVVRHTMPAGWPDFQARCGLRTAAEILALPRSANPTPEARAVDRATATHEEVNLAIGEAARTGATLTILEHGKPRVQVVTAKPVRTQCPECSADLGCPVCDAEPVRGEKCGSLCVACEALPEDAAPSECLCHWCLIRHASRAYQLTREALFKMTEMGGPAAELAARTLEEAMHLSVMPGLNHVPLRTETAPALVDAVRELLRWTSGGCLDCEFCPQQGRHEHDAGCAMAAVVATVERAMPEKGTER